jgi:hypothetical protein
MRIIAEISPDDHLDVIEMLSREGIEEAKATVGARRLSRDRSELIVSMAIFFGTLIWSVYALGLEGLFGHWIMFVLVLIGIFNVPVALVWLMGVRRMRADLAEVVGGKIIDQKMLRNGVNIGEATFELDHDGLSVRFAFLKETFLWSAFQGLRETSRAFHLIIDEVSGLILPKRALGDTARRQEFSIFVAERIGSSV